MPEIFQDNNKLKIIEYGNNESMMDIVKDATDSIFKLIRKS